MRSIAGLFLLAILAACAAPGTGLPVADPAAVAAEAARQRAIADAAQYDRLNGTRRADSVAYGETSSIEAARRLYTVADQVALRGASLCGGALSPRTGLRLWSLDSVNPRSAAAVAARYGLDTAPTVFAVAPDGPAARAGLRPGDRIVAVDGWAVPGGPGALRAYGMRLSEVLRENVPLTIAYRRAGRDATAQLTPARACAYPVQFADTMGINAVTNGERILVARGLVEMLERDEELALVIGHEMAHNVLGHPAAKRASRMTGIAPGGTLAFSQSIEHEADYVGLYFVALAGYDYARAGNAWRRMAIRRPRAIAYSTTHPTSAARFVALEMAAREIAGKASAGQKLVPNAIRRDTPASDRDTLGGR